MRHVLRMSVFVPTAWLSFTTTPAFAQQRDSSALRLSAVARGAVETYNASTTTRVSGAYDVPPSKVISGDVAVLNGPVTIAGRIEGSLVAINADVRFTSGGSVDRQLFVVGGGIAGRDGARIGGDILQQAELLRYHLDGERLVADREPEYDDTWWRRHNVKHDLRRGAAYTDFFFVASRAYNRVEGLSFVVGPRFQRFPDWGKINVEAFGVVRTAEPVKWDNQTLGHEAKAEVQFGKPIGVAIGARAFDVVQPTESWQLSDGEAGLASVILHRDYRDYYGRHGGESFVRIQGGENADLTVSFSDEQWSDRRERDPWTLFRGSEPWRPNPLMDVGGMHLLTTRLRIDTRDRVGSSLAGWYLVGEVEQGAGRLTRLGAPILTFAPLRPEEVQYSRGFIDLRRYNRIVPELSLDLRLAGGGWLSGDPLPTERRLSVGGPGTLPGYAFREVGPNPDMLQCAALTQPGTPAQCDRVALMQVELRSSFLFGSLRDDERDDWWRPGFNHRMHWVLFADAGRGWNVGTPDGGLTYDKGTLPSLDSFKMDLGGGIDFGGLGVYWAKALRDAGQPVRFIMRLEHRF
ncbi:MAG: hypothetical protein ACHQQ3_01895 [Gemmatimonadales bacterium]